MLAKWPTHRGGTFSRSGKPMASSQAANGATNSCRKPGPLICGWKVIGRNGRKLLLFGRVKWRAMHWPLGGMEWKMKMNLLAAIRANGMSNFSVSVPNTSNFTFCRAFPSKRIPLFRCVPPAESPTAHQGVEQQARFVRTNSNRLSAGRRVQTRTASLICSLSHALDWPVNSASASAFRETKFGLEMVGTTGASQDPGRGRGIQHELGKGGGEAVTVCRWRLAGGKHAFLEAFWAKRNERTAWWEDGRQSAIFCSHFGVDFGWANWRLVFQGTDCCCCCWIWPNFWMAANARPICLAALE